MLESWYDVVKKVMRLRKKGTLAGGHDHMQSNDVEDFFVYMFDEEEFNNQLQFNPKKKKTRILIFTHLNIF